MKLTSLPILLLPIVTDAFVIVPSQKAVLTSSTALEGIMGRFRKKKEIQAPGTIKVGSSIPDIDVEMLTKDGDGDDVTFVPVSASEVLGAPGKSILLGMPGAFTPTCTGEHLPGFIEKSAKLRKLGVETIAVVTTNDKFVNEQWARSQGLVAGGAEKSVITMLADGDGELVKALGLVDDMGFGVGLRSKRFALVLEDGRVSQVLTDEGMDSCDFTSAANLVKVLTPVDQAVEEEMDAKTLAIVGGGIALVLVAALMMGGGDDHSNTAATVMPAVKSVAPAVKGGTDFGLLRNFGS